MVYICYYCSCTRTTVRELIVHYTKYCQQSNYNFDKVFYCGENSCHASYTNNNAFRKHLYREHTSKSLLTNPTDLNLCSSKTNVVCDPSPPANILNDSSNVGSLSILNKSSNEGIQNSVKDSLSKEISSLMLDLYSNANLPRSCTQTCFKGLKNIIVGYNKILIEQIRQLPLNNESLSQVMTTLMGLSTDCETTFSSFESEYKRIKYLTSLGTYISPQEIVIGSRMDYKFAGHTDYVPVQCTMQLVPLNLVLSKFFYMENVLRETLEYTRSLEKESHIIKNIIQGSVWKKMKTKFDPNVINFPIILYLDDFETGNPLGAHASIHKLCGVYISLPCLPPKYVSHLNCIFVLALFHAADRIEFGNKVIFNPIINMLNLLSSEGISINVPNIYQGTIRFHTVCITGDNLGLHGALGFVECFSARYCCRICSIEKKDMQVTYVEKKELLRDSMSYYRDLKIGNASETGIKSESVWSDLKGFDLFENVAVDVMHDFLEGVGRYVVEFVLTFFVQSGIVSVNKIQNRFLSFDFGPDSSSRPVNSILSEKSGVKIKSSASEMTNIIRYMGLIVGSYIPEEHEVWELYLLLRQLLDRLLVQTEVILNRTELQVSYLINNLCREYCRLTKSPLKPKFHFLLHYSNMLKKLGPLSSYWTMRFEGKHRPLKISAKVTCNKLNICKTIAQRAQCTLCHLFNSNEAFKFFDCGKLTSLDLSSDDILNEFEENHLYASCKWFKLDGITIKERSVFIEDLSLETEEPKFIQVQKILIHNDTKDVILVCRALETLEFDSHYYAYQVELTEKIVFIRYLDLYSVIPNTLTVMPNSTLFVTLRSTID
ncbi:uncharacterized protein LOC113472738 [Diaphorina citri]|jgi:hypothetical protein|uniref:Uncharacterized protein LOC113472738 n=1 Tax=Diaphorina citri TaxID=121845 RepID=A0A3Q0JIX1_DIACI|nr:uncharacterized protein LOC113472738 [Diaphorina citri]